MLHTWRAGSARFDDPALLASAGLVPVMGLAERTGLTELLANRVRPASWRVASGAANPAGKATAIIAGMCAGADSIDDLQVLRSGGLKRVLGGVYAPATLGIFLREFTHGHTRQLHSAMATHLIALARDTPVLSGIGEQAFIDIDSMLRPVYGHSKQGASYGHTKIASRQVLRLGLSPLITTISTAVAAPVIAGMRLRAGKAGSGRGAAIMVTEAINTARQAGATKRILVRGDSAFGNHKVVAACRKHGANFSVVLTKSPAVMRAIASIPESAWTPVHYPGAVLDPDTGQLISDAEVAEVCFTAFTGKAKRYRVTARLIVRRIKALSESGQDGMFPAYRYHPFFTDNDEPVAAADLTHRAHAIIETVNSDLIDGPLAHQPSKLFPANSAWCILAGMAHNLLRAAGTLTGYTRWAVARGATLRRQLVNVPAKVTRPQGRPELRLPAAWPWEQPWLALWAAIFPAGKQPPCPA